MSDDSLEELHAANAYLKGHFSHRIPKEQYVQLWTWIGARNTFGEECYGEAPRLQKELEREPGKKQQLDKALEQEPAAAVEKIIDLERIEQADKLDVNSRTYTK
jgi:hypothetical protein